VARRSSALTDATLLGMLIAGSSDGSNLSVMIPSYELVKTDNYVGLAAGEKLVLTNSFS